MIKTGLIYITTLFSAWLLFISCIPEPLEVKGLPKVKPQIVVSTQIIPDQSLVVLLTKSLGALDASKDSDVKDVIDQIAVNDALVILTGNNQIDTLLFLGNGFYGGVNISFEEVEYSLYVRSESLGEVSAVTTVKPRINFENINASLYYDGFDDTLAQVSYSFEDPSEKNWYIISVIQVEQNELRSDLLNPGNFSRLLNDNEFEGEVYSETFRVFPTEFQKGDTIAVYLSNVSAEYYQFNKMRVDNRFSLLEFLSEPVNYPSNVKGGKGFFNLYVPDVRFFVLE